MSVPAQMQILAARLPAVLGHHVVSGQIVLRFDNGVLRCAGKMPDDLLRLAVLLRETFGKAIRAEEIAVNFNGGVLNSIERRAQHFEGVETREYFRVQSARGPERKT